MHFTYEEAAKTDRVGLRQGDVLRRTEDINRLLETVHPYYLSQPDYRFLQVLTQSCDLERRDGQCSSRYITLAAVRPLSLVLQREIDIYRKGDLEREAKIADAGYRHSVENFVERLLNNNEDRYFYLHEQLDAGLSEPLCTFLPLSIAVRSGEHYDKCLAAKVLQLRPDFQAKLGWLVGNMYSRVGTDDWVPTVDATRDVFLDRIKSLVDREAFWIDRKRYKKLREALATEARPIQSGRVQAILADLVVQTKLEQALARLRILLPQLGLPAANVETAIHRIGSDPEFSQRLKER